MSKCLYTAEIRHTEKTIESIYRAEYFAFEKLRIYARLAVGVAFIAFALITNLPTWAKGILLLIGAWLAVSSDFQAQIRADKALQERRAALPKMEYEFHESTFHISGEGDMNARYAQLIHLSEDKDYFYLFLSRTSVCMIDRSSIRPKGDAAFKEFIEKRTDLKFKREISLLAMSLYDILDIFKLRKAEKGTKRK